MFRKGAGNVEFIIAFVLFVSFIATAIYFFNPAKDMTAIESLNNYAFESIVKNVTIGMNSYSVKLITLAGTCENKMSVKINDSWSRAAYVENYSGKKIESGQLGDLVYFDKGSEQFVTIKLAEDLEKGTLTSSLDYAFNADCYEISSSIKSNVLSEKRILELNKTYYEDYNRLKDSLSIPDSADFSFSVEFSNGDKITAKREMSSQTEVYSKMERKEVLREKGNSEFVYFTTAVW